MENLSSTKPVPGAKKLGTTALHLSGELLTGTDQTPDRLYQNLWAWQPDITILIKLPVDSTVQSSWRPTDLELELGLEAMTT